MLMLGCSQRRPYFWLLPTRAWASTLFVMGGRQRLLNMLCSSYTHTGSTLRVMVSYTLTGRMVYIKYKHIFRITLSVHINWSSSCIRYFITVVDSSPEFIYFIFTSCTTHSTHLFCRGTVRSSSGWSDHLLDGLHRQPTGRTARHSLLLGIHFAINQLVQLLIAWASLLAT